MVKKPKKSLVTLIPVMVFALILLIGASAQAPIKAESSAYSPNKIMTPTYSWKRDHCESCYYLAEQIKQWMQIVKKSTTSAHAALMANNYLKLYELNECHKYYRNTSIGPFHMALELKALEEKRLE